MAHRLRNTEVDKGLNFIISKLSLSNEETTEKAQDKKNNFHFSSELLIITNLKCAQRGVC